MASSKSKVENAFHEVYTDVPKNVTKTGKTGAAKKAMMTAIALSKARQAGAKIPSMKDGGVVKETGLHLLHKDEVVIPATARKSNMSDTKLTREMQVLPDSKFRAGSEGSKIGESNPVCKPTAYGKEDVMRGNRGNETREQHSDNRNGAGLLKTTDHPFAADAIIDNTIHDNQPEMTRRENSHARDRRTGFKVTDDRVYADND